MPVDQVCKLIHDKVVLKSNTCRSHTPESAFQRSGQTEARVQVMRQDSGLGNSPPIVRSLIHACAPQPHQLQGSVYAASLAGQTDSELS